MTVRQGRHAGGEGFIERLQLSRLSRRGVTHRYGRANVRGGGPGPPGTGPPASPPARHPPPAPTGGPLMRFIPNIIAVGLLATLAATGLAHDTWLLPERTHVPAGTALTFDLTSGMEFPTLDHAIQPDRVEQGRCRLRGRTTDLTPASADRSLRFTARPAGEGRHRLGAAQTAAARADGGEGGRVSRRDRRVGGRAPGVGQCRPAAALARGLHQARQDVRGRPARPATTAVGVSRSVRGWRSCRNRARPRCASVSG